MSSQRKKISLTITIIALVIFGLGIHALSEWIEGNYVNPATQLWEEKVENIERIFFHENFRFTYLVRRGNVIEPVSLTYFWEKGTKVTYYEDVPPNKSMWAVVQGKGNSKDGIITNIEIHLHTVKEVDGGGWNHGKFGSGNTIVVE